MAGFEKEAAFGSAAVDTMKKSHFARRNLTKPQELHSHDARIRVETARGTGEFIGGDTSEAGRADYQEIIDAFHQAHPDYPSRYTGQRGGAVHRGSPPAEALTGEPLAIRNKSYMGWVGYLVNAAISAIRLEQHCLPVKIDELALALREAAYINQSLCLDSHPLK